MYGEAVSGRHGCRHSFCDLVLPTRICVHLQNTFSIAQQFEDSKYTLVGQYCILIGQHTYIYPYTIDDCCCCHQQPNQHIIKANKLTYGLAVERNCIKGLHQNVRFCSWKIFNIFFYYKCLRAQAYFTSNSFCTNIYLDNQMKTTTILFTITDQKSKVQKLPQDYTFDI